MGLGFDGFACRGCRGSWVYGFFSLLYPSPPSLPLTVRLLSPKFFFFGYGVDFWMNANCGGNGLAMGLGLLLNVVGLWWWRRTVASR